MLSLADRGQIIKIYYLNGESLSSTLKKFCCLKGIRKRSDMPSHVTIKRIVDKFETHHTLEDLPRSGRPQISEETIEFVDSLLKEMRDAGLNSSCRNVSQQCPVSKSSVHRILRKSLHYFPYKIQIGQILTPDHQERRKSFCQYFIQNFPPDVLCNVLFSDEASFSLNGLVNRQNTRFWGNEPPTDIVERSGFSQKLILWCGFSQTVRLPLVILESTKDSDVYIDMMKKLVIPELNKAKVSSRIIFQQDGARAHTSKKSLDFLQEVFPAGVISDKLENGWPPCSPDLSPVDFWLWGYLRDKVYSAPRPKTIGELKEKVITCYENIPRWMFRKAISSVPKRMELCILENGKHFEQYII